MRWAPFVILIAGAVALSAAVLGDAVTEAAANFAAGHAVDGHQEALLPGAALAITLVSTLCVLAAGAGRARAEALNRLMASRPLRIAFFVSTALLTLAIVVAMEGYETRFGGLSAFDAHAVLSHDLVPALGTYAGVVALVDRLLRACVRAALCGWEALLRAASTFVRRRVALYVHAMLDTRDQDPPAANAGRTHPSWSLRAPPPVLGQVMSAARFWGTSWSVFARPRAFARSS